jgi:Ca2+-binding RTX toxin-like protein
VALGLVLALACPSPAAAGTAARVLNSNFVTYDADVNEVNNLTIALEGADHTFTDTTAPVIADSGCFQVTPNKARCPASPDDVTGAFLKDGDDRGTVTSPIDSNICGGLGGDTLQAGPGGGGMWGEEGSDVLTGGEALDILFAEADCQGVPSDLPPAPNELSGGGGFDILDGGAANDSLDGGDGPDGLFGNEGDDAVEGGPGDDIVTGSEGSDMLGGGEGDDLLGGGAGNDAQAGGAGNDQLGVTYVSGEVVHVDEGDDTLDGGSGDDRLLAGPGALALDGVEDEPTESDVPNGRDELRGGDGRDTASYAGRLAGVSVTLDDAPNDGSADEGDNLHADLESVEGGSGDDTLTGGAGPDTLDGARGSDEVYGGAGDDSLAGGAEDGGADTLEGGDGADALRGGAGADALRGQAGRDDIGGGGGSDDIRGGEDGDMLSGGTGLDSVSGGPGDDSLDGAQAVLVGADGADRLSGGEGTDSLRGGPGDDRLAGGPGPDTMAGQEGTDTVDYGEGARRVRVTFDDAPNDGEPGELDNVMSDVEDARGGDQQDSFIGDGKANTLRGGAGADYVDGGGGTDDLRGGHDNDTVRARDARVDRVRCGRGRDLAIVDRQDRVLPGCERVDRGRTRPRLGRDAIVRPVRGAVRMRLPGTERWVPLIDRVQLPLRSVIDASRGEVRLTAAGSRRSGGRSARVSGGEFTGRQRRRSGAPTELSLVGPFRRLCPPGSGGRVARELTVRSPVGFRTRGRHASATGRSAEWSTEDRCDGTMVRVRRGRVTVVDRERHRRRTLRAGQTYLARRR